MAIPVIANFRAIAPAWRLHLAPSRAAASIRDTRLDMTGVVTVNPARTERTFMSKETPRDDPRQETDWKSPKQTDKPWKGNPEKEQQRTGPPPDLDEWQESNTH